MNIDQLAYTDVETAARTLLGRKLVRTLPDGSLLGGIIVETEAYHESEPAAHTYNGRTERNAVMFGPAGRAYVYFTYGMHYCLNVVTGREGEGAAVLIRALQPVEGEDIMHENRRNRQHLQVRSLQREGLCSGPAKLTQAMDIDRELNGYELNQPPLQLLPGENVAGADIIQTTRIGIRRATDIPWRFCIRSNPYVSK